MQPKITKHYAYRRNADNTIDSICLICFLTVATAKNESLLSEAERSHKCRGDSFLAAERAIPFETLHSEERTDR
jgi:hypothetical protein